MGEPVQGESGGTVLARAAIVQRLARLGCIETIGQCWVLWRREREGRASVQADLRRGVYSAIARAGGDAEMRQLISLYERVENGEERRPLFTALAQSSQKRQVLDWAISEQVQLKTRSSSLLALLRVELRVGRWLGVSSERSRTICWTSTPVGNC